MSEVEYLSRLENYDKTHGEQRIDRSQAEAINNHLGEATRIRGLLGQD